MGWQDIASKMSSITSRNKEEDEEFRLGQPAILQIVSKSKGRPDAEINELIRQIEGSCLRFDKSGTKALTVDQYYNVIKLQHHVDCSKDEIRRLVADLEMDKEYRVAIKDFMSIPIMSRSVFDQMDKNKDGLVSKGELRLAQKGFNLKDLAEILQEVDNDGDGKLTFDEIRSVIRRARKKKAAKVGTSSAKEFSMPNQDPIKNTKVQKSPDSVPPIRQKQKKPKKKSSSSSSSSTSTSTSTSNNSSGQSKKNVATKFPKIKLT